jgi:DNA-binding CsgD family transcriptional regulator
MYPRLAYRRPTFRRNTLSTRDWDLREATTPTFSAARLGFTRAEQQLLRQAILGYTDVELARRLEVALPTVKNRWRALYDRLGHIAPELVVEIDGSSNPAVRGQEKRRRLVDYVRPHPEELRPGLWRTRTDRKEARQCETERASPAETRRALAPFGGAPFNLQVAAYNFTLSFAL